MSKFSKDFLIGAATAAHQVEGNNIYNDCWAQEHMEHSSYAEPSMDAVDHYNRYEEDIKLMADAGLNAYRFSIEWSRIEPEDGQFNSEAVEHYRKVIACCKQNSIEPIVTLHHFSSPVWLIEKGGWEVESVVCDFARYVRYVIGELGSELNRVCTINEANMGIQVASIAKRYMMQMQKQAGTTKDVEGKVQMGLNLEKMLAKQKAVTEENCKVFGTPNPQTFTSTRTAKGDMLIVKAHQVAKSVIKELYPNIEVGLTLSLHDIQAQPGGEENAAKEWEEEFRHYLPYIQEDDFLGVQNYTRTLVGPEGTLPIPDNVELTQMNYELYPEALEHVIRKVSQDFKGDLIVTENGVAISDDTRRVEFIAKATDGIIRCIEDGILVKGYFYWSLLDNFEWQKGFSITFGLIAVERSTQMRKPKPSLAYLGNL